MRLLLVIPASTYRTHDFMSAAERLDIELVVATNFDPALSALVEDTTLAVNFAKVKDVRRQARRYAARKPLDYVLGVDDQSAYIAAVIADELNLPHNPLSALERARNKFLMRQAISEAGMLSPWFRLFPLKKNSAKIASEIKFPVVVKPTFLSASRGVSRVDSAGELAEALANIRQLMEVPEVRYRAYGKEAARVLVESYIPGVEVALEGLLTNGELKTLAIFDKPDPLEGPHFVETIYLTPSRLPAYVQREVIHTVARGANALGLATGPIHAEVRINEKGAYLVEIAARSIGGLCSRALRFDGGMSLEELILRHTIGEDVAHIQRDSQAAGVMMIPIPKAGILSSVDGKEEAKQVEGIEDIIISIPKNHPVQPMPRGGKYLGFIFSRGDSPERAEAAIRKAHRKLNININPDAGD